MIGSGEPCFALVGRRLRRLHRLHLSLNDQAKLKPETMISK